MKPCLKSVLILFAVVFAFGTFQVEDASAQGPIIRRMREKLNNGKPLLPFIADLESETPKAPAKKPTPASKPTPAKKSPTPAKTPTPAEKPQKYPRIKLESESASNSNSAAQRSGRLNGFGMAIEEVGESFVVSQIDPRGNAASAGVKRGDVVTAIGGAKLMAVAEYDGIADAMSGGDRVEFEVSRRGSKSQKIVVQFGQPEERDDEDESGRFDVAPALDPVPTKRSFSDRYEPSVGSGLRSIYDGTEKPSSILTPTPAPPRSNRIESLKELDFPALDGGK